MFTPTAPTDVQTFALRKRIKPRRLAARVCTTTTILVLLIDQASKAAARSTLTLCEPSPVSACERFRVAGVLELVRVRNGGSALGFGQGMTLWLVMALLGLVVVAAYLRGRRDRLLLVGAGLQLGGALGNLLDRVTVGGVTDFIHTGPVVLNLADLALLVGAALGTFTLARRPPTDLDPGMPLRNRRTDVEASHKSL